MPSPKAVALVLSKAEREQLEAWARRRKSAQALAQRSRIVLAAAAGHSNTEIAERFAITRGMVAKWRSRFASERLDGLVDEPRPGRPRTITDAQVEEVIVRTLETTPKDATHWSTRSMAAQVGLSQTAVSRIWRAFGLQPHRVETLEAVEGPAVHRQGPRRRRPVPRPARARGRACASMRRARSRRSTAPRRSCRCCRARPRGPRTTTSAPGTSSLYAALDIDSAAR